MNHLCQLVSKDLLCPVEVYALPPVHLVDLLKRQEGQHTDAFHDVAVIDIAPVLEEVIRACLFRVKPHGISCGLAHFFAL